jgi:type I restriction enzyme M protein
MSSNQSGEGEIRKAIIEADLVDCMIALPSQLFYSTPISACLWFLARNKKNGKFRDRSGQTLFINARMLGHLVDRTHKELSEEKISQIAHVYHAWRGEKEAGEYQDVPGFCKSAITEEVAEHNYILIPGRYVGATEIEEDDERFEEKITRLTGKLVEQFHDSATFEGLIQENLKRLGIW